MYKQLGKEYSDKAEREQFLKNNCDKLENIGYMKPYTRKELQGHKKNLANLSIQIGEIEKKKKEAAKVFKEQLAPLIERQKEIVNNIQQKGEYVNEICYKFIDREEKQTGIYNSEGDLIELRPATADELQPVLFARTKFEVYREEVETNT